MRYYEPKSKNLMLLNLTICSFLPFIKPTGGCSQFVFQWTCISLCMGHILKRMLENIFVDVGPLKWPKGQFVFPCAGVRLHMREGVQEHA